MSCRRRCRNIYIVKPACLAIAVLLTTNLGIDMSKPRLRLTIARTASDREQSTGSTATATFGYSWGRASGIRADRVVTEIPRSRVSFASTVLLNPFGPEGDDITWI